MKNEDFPAGLMDMEEAPAAAPMRGNEQCVPTEALAIPGEGEQLEAPEPGDWVSYTVEGKVSRIEGGKAYVDAETVNGVAVENSKEQTPPEAQEADAYRELEAQAGQVGQMI